jgi:hypothetical protein
MDMQSAQILEARYQADDFAAKAHAELRAELLEALDTNPNAIVRTPGYGSHPNGRTVRMTAAEVVADQLDGDHGPLLALLKLLTDAANGINVQAQAKTLRESFATAHADYHAEFVE